MTIEEMKQRKKEYGYTYDQISALSGVPLATVQKVCGGITTSPRHDTLRALENVFLSREYHYTIGEGSQPNMLRESTSYLGKRQGEYTVEDYWNLPDDCRAELIDGVFYDLAAPLNTHQQLMGEIYLQLKLFIRKQKGKCIVQFAPSGVQLDCDDKTMLEPDVFVVCDRNKFLERNIYGAPDFVVEVLSPSTQKKDSITKLYKYQNAGVREYWLVDPKRQMVLVYDFSAEHYPVIYGFSDEIPVGIWNGECKIDLKELMEEIEFLKEFEQ